MPTVSSQLVPLLRRLHDFRVAAGLTTDQVEQALLIGPGWIAGFETGAIAPSLDVLLALLRLYQRLPAELFADLALVDLPEQPQQFQYAVQEGNDLIVHFEYAKHDAQYRLRNATKQQYDSVIRSLRDGLARREDNEAAKANAVATAYLRATQVWPHANPSDLWWFIVSRAFYDPFNHPVAHARLDFGQSWKRSGGWALEIVLARHYAPILRQNNISLEIAIGDRKPHLARQFQLTGRMEVDKIDVFLVGIVGQREIPFGVVHVKASFAERRTDDVPLSQAMVNAGYVSPLWTMDCKSMPGTRPVNRGELGLVVGNVDSRSAKRKDVEDEGYFSACFSYNTNTAPTPQQQNARARVHVCNFTNPDDAFSQFIIQAWADYKVKRNIR